MINQAIQRKIERLQAGETIISREAGNSMLPILASMEPVELSPVNWEDCETGDIVFCKVGGHYYTHKVYAKNDKKGLQIGNNHGHVNGWTTKVYGKARLLSKEEKENLKKKKND